jgi:hypothetical protein
LEALPSKDVQFPEDQLLAQNHLGRNGVTDGWTLPLAGREFLRKAFADNSLTHQSADLESHSLASWNLYLLECLGILRNSSCALADFKDSKVAEFQAISIGQFVDHFIKKQLDSFLDFATLLASLL